MKIIAQNKTKTKPNKRRCDMWYEGVESARPKGKFISTKIGSDFEMEIKKIYKVTNKPSFEPEKKDGSTQGFLFEFEGLVNNELRIMTISSFVFQDALINAQCREGDRIRVTHPDNGVYHVEVISSEVPTSI